MHISWAFATFYNGMKNNSASDAYLFSYLVRDNTVVGSPIASSLKPSIEVTCPNMAKHGYLHHGQKYDKNTVSHIDLQNTILSLVTVYLWCQQGAIYFLSQSSCLFL